MKIETKYDIGQEVWGVFADSIVKGFILEIIIFGRNDILYKLCVDLQSPSLCISEESLFLAKEELLKSL